jgi:hypothetical protein
MLASKNSAIGMFSRLAAHTAVTAAVFWFFSLLLAFAADATFPTGSRVGIVPPPGMVLSKNFMGFEDTDKNTAIIFAGLPAAAYGQLDKTMTTELLQKQGVSVDKREPINIGDNKGFILSGKQSSPKGRIRKWLMVLGAGDLTALVTVQTPDQGSAYSDQAVRDALGTVAIRANVPDAERMSLLPFIVGDLAGFHVDDVIPGNTLMLIDTPPAAGDAPPDPTRATHFLISAQPGGPEEPADRDNFARVSFDQIGGLRDVHIQDAGPLRLGGQPGYQILASAKENDTSVMVIQWLRFGTGGYLQMIGISRADGWPPIFMRLRAVRDSIDPKR